MGQSASIDRARRSLSFCLPLHRCVLEEWACVKIKERFHSWKKKNVSLWQILSHFPSEWGIKFCETCFKSIQIDKSDIWAWKFSLKQDNSTYLSSAWYIYENLCISRVEFSMYHNFTGMWLSYVWIYIHFGLYTNRQNSDNWSGKISFICSCCWPFYIFVQYVWYLCIYVPSLNPWGVAKCMYCMYIQRM